MSQGTFGTFGGITLSATDYYGQVYVYDTACSCIKILDATGTVFFFFFFLIFSCSFVSVLMPHFRVGVWTKMINTTSVPTFLSVSLNHIFVVDQDGVLRYSDGKIKLNVIFHNNFNYFFPLRRFGGRCSGFQYNMRSSRRINDC